MAHTLPVIARDLVLIAAAFAAVSFAADVVGRIAARRHLRRVNREAAVLLSPAHLTGTNPADR